MSQKITHYILLILAFTFIFGLFSVEIKDPDFWWHLKTGEYIYQTGSLPETDPFAYTSLSKDPIHPESKRIRFILTQYWFAQVFFYWIYHLFGFQGIIFLRASLLTLLVLLVYKSVRREGAGFYLSMALLVPIVIVLHTFTGERPQLFSFLFSFLLIYLLEGFRKRETVKAETPRISGLFYLLPIPFIMLLWANLHGGFVVGIAVILGYLFSEWGKYLTKRFGVPLPPGSLKIFTVISILSLIASLINPNGYTFIPFLLELERSLYMAMITEAMSPLKLLRLGFYEIHLVTYFILLLVTVALFPVQKRKPDLTDGVLIAVLAFLSLSVSRVIPFFIPAAVLMIARYRIQFLSRFQRGIEVIRRNAEVPLNIFLIIALVLMLVNGDLFKTGIRKNVYPEGAVKFLKENRIQGNMFNPYVWGGYLMWELYPEYKVFIDGRGLIGEVFFQEVKILEAYRKTLEGMPEWKAMLSAYNVDFVLTFSVGNFTGRLVPLVKALLNDPDWHLVYMDNISLIFLRNSPENKELLQKSALPKEWLWNEVAVEAALKAQAYRNNVSFYITMGDAFISARKYRDAKEAFQKILERDPGNRIAKKRLELLRAYGY